MNYFIDTGPLVSYLDEKDEHHRWAGVKLAKLKPPFVTCEAIISEAVFLLQYTNVSPDELFKFIARGDLVIRPAFVNGEAQEYIREVVNTYSNLPADFGDACLAYMAGNFENPDYNQIITVDSDFFVYRKKNGQPFSVIHPQTG